MALALALALGGFGVRGAGVGKEDNDGLCSYRHFSGFGFLVNEYGLRFTTYTIYNKRLRFPGSQGFRFAFHLVSVWRFASRRWRFSVWSLEFGDLGSGDTQGTERVCDEATKWKTVGSCGFGLSLFFFFGFTDISFFSISDLQHGQGHSYGARQRLLLYTHLLFAHQTAD